MNSLRVRLLAALLGVGVAAFVAALLTALWVSRDRVEAQMASQAQSIALSLTVALTAGGEPSLQNAESLVEPVFDQSYLRRIAVRDAQQRIVASREAPARLAGGAPQWFVDLLPLASGAQTADIMAGSKFRNAGQVCVSPTRFYVQEQSYSKFLARFTEYAKNIKLGDGLEKGTTMGPLANPRRLDAMESQVRGMARTA